MPNLQRKEFGISRLKSEKKYYNYVILIEIMYDVNEC